MPNHSLSLAQQETASAAAISPTPGRLFWAFLRLGALAFGGPAMVARIRHDMVGRKAWIDDRDFKTGVALCQAIPGATAIQTATYVGLRLDGMRGALAAHVAFALPAFCMITGLAYLYEGAATVQRLQTVLGGLRVVVVALVAHGAWSFARSSLRGVRDTLIAVIAAVALLKNVSPALVVVAAALAGAVFVRVGPQSIAGQRATPGRWLLRLVGVMTFGVAWIGILAWLRPNLASLGLVMMKADATAFGGGFASLPVLLHDVVKVWGWMPEATFLDGVALGQITPGPIVITSAFIGYRVRGLAGAAVAAISIFLPSFFGVIATEPWFGRLQAIGWFRGASHGALLSFVGLLAAVTLQFIGMIHWSVIDVLVCMAAFAVLFANVQTVWVIAVTVAAYGLRSLL